MHLSTRHGLITCQFHFIITVHSFGGAFGKHFTVQFDGTCTAHPLFMVPTWTGKLGNWENFFQSGNFEQTGNFREIYPKYWKNKEFYPKCWKSEENF